METVEDIVREMRGECDHSGMVCFGEGGEVYLDNLADRLDAAYKRDLQAMVDASEIDMRTAIREIERLRNENHGSFVASSDGSQSVAFCGEETVFSDGKAKRTPRKRNARLIAAAPEMYECLREAVNEMCRDCMETKEECPQKDNGACFVLRWRAVLAKAAGEDAGHA